MEEILKETITRSDYERHFKDYPDVVDLIQFREMLGGLSDSVARRLVQEHAVENFVIDSTYYIPKIRVIDYVMSRHYELLKETLKHQIVVPTDKTCVK